MAKIFVIGNVNGQLETAFGKLASLHAKNDFAFAIVAGNLFSPEQDDDDAVTRLLDGSVKIPVSTYFTVGTTALPPRVVEKIERDEEICENLHYLGKRSVTKTSEGIRIVALGGALDTTIVGGLSKEQHLPFHTQQDASSLRSANSADILLTALWPAGVWNGSKAQLPVEPADLAGSEAVADLCAALKPRYHFSTSPADFCYEREPFFHPPAGDAADPSSEVTRFISLASLNNPAKAKAMYAFALRQETAVSVPQGSTGSPFWTGGAPGKKKRADDGETYSRFATGGDHGGRRHGKKSRRDRSPPPGPDRCFFCLSNPNLPTHMVVSVGDDSYLATAKGPLPQPTTFAEQGLDFPGHLIMVPLTHAPTITTAAMEGSADKTFREMTRFREALQAMVSARTRRRLGAVTWEISRARNIHVHWQLVAVDAALVRRGLVEAAFRVEAENNGWPCKFEARDFGDADEVLGDYFRVWIWAEEEEGDEGAAAPAPAADGAGAGAGGRIISKSLLLRFDENIRFDLQFGRRVMAKLMGLERRVVWQDCGQTVEEETADKEASQRAFKDWDFTL